VLNINSVAVKIIPNKVDIYLVVAVAIAIGEVAKHLPFHFGMIMFKPVVLSGQSALSRVAASKAF